MYDEDHEKLYLICYLARFSRSTTYLGQPWISVSFNIITTCWPTYRLQAEKTKSISY